MPLFAFGEERFDPHLALAHRLSVRLAGVAGTHLIQIGFSDVAVHAAAAVTRGAGGVDWAGITDRWISPIFHFLGRVLDVIAAQQLALGTDVDIVLRVIGELPRSVVVPLVLPLRVRARSRRGSPRARLEGGDVLDGAVGREVVSPVAWRGRR